MNRAEELKKIQDEIFRLQARRQQLDDEAIQEKIEQVKSLEWLRGKTVDLVVNSWAAAGIPTYTLTVRERVNLLDDLVRTGNLIVLMGDDKSYHNNIVLRRLHWDSTEVEISTNNGELLCEFIERADVKIRLYGDRKKVYEMAVRCCA